MPAYTHMFILRSCTYVYVHSTWNHSLIGMKYMKKNAGSITCISMPLSTPKTSKYAERHPCVCERSGKEALSVCQNFPEFISNCAEQMAHCDMADWFYRAPQWSHCHCDQLCLPSAIGWGSYNRRLGGPGPPRTVLQLSRCGEGVGWGGLGSATVEKWPN